MQAFVAITDAASAAAAKDAIHGRMFAGVSLRVDFVTEEYFVTVLAAA